MLGIGNRWANGHIEEHSDIYARSLWPYVRAHRHQTDLERTGGSLPRRVRRPMPRPRSTVFTLQPHVKLECRTVPPSAEDRRNHRVSMQRKINFDRGTDQVAARLPGNK